MLLLIGYACLSLFNNNTAQMMEDDQHSANNTPRALVAEKEGEPDGSKKQILSYTELYCIENKITRKKSKRLHQTDNVIIMRIQHILLATMRFSCKIYFHTPLGAAAASTTTAWHQ